MPERDSGISRAHALTVMILGRTQTFFFAVRQAEVHSGQFYRRQIAVNGLFICSFLFNLLVSILPTLVKINFNFKIVIKMIEYYLLQFVIQFMI